MDFLKDLYQCSLDLIMVRAKSSRQHFEDYLVSEKGSHSYKLNLVQFYN